jgi:YrbI family 3-deoxy-D-manno-octulosonate 8-phosphate phosphatase
MPVNPQTAWRDFVNDLKPLYRGLLNLEQKERLEQIKALVCDVDGVLTDGTLWLGDDQQWRRRFHILDGLGLKLLHQQGIKVGWITGSKSIDIEARAKALLIDELAMGAEAKLPLLQAFCDKWQISLAEVAYVGDDLPDLPVLKAVGLPFTVPNAHRQVLQNASFLVTTLAGGQGAVREIADLVLSCKGVVPSVPIQSS